MSATDLMVKHPDLHIRAYTDSIRRYGGFDCTDHNNDKANVNNSGHSSSQHGKEQQPMSAPTEMSSAEVIPTGSSAAATAAATTTSRLPVDLNREDVRLVTFDNESWDVPFLNKAKLAQIGFYYIGPQDTVKCHFCRVEIGKWEADDDCFTEHSRWSPSCPLLRRQQTDNVPIDADDLNQILPPITYDTCGLSGGGVLIRPNAYAERSFTPHADHDISSLASSARSSPESASEAVVGSTSPFRFTATQQSIPAAAVMDPHAVIMAAASPPHAPPQAAPLLATMSQMYSGSSSNYFNPVTTPHLEIEANRLRTFKEWPIQLKMKPLELSDAGFFYTGMGDRVQCYSCGGGLKNWEDEDVAWEQHALWYPNCEYMKLIKGQKYIDAVQTVHRQKQQLRQSGGEGGAEDEDDEDESSSEGGDNDNEVGVQAGQDEVPLARRMAGSRQRSPMASTSVAGAAAGAGAGHGELRKIARRRTSKISSGSHPEADLSSAEAMLAAKAAKPSEVPETKLCKICYECEFNTAFIPCGHVVACAKCASAVTTCPMCREPFDSVTRIYFS